MHRRQFLRSTLATLPLLPGLQVLGRTHLKSQPKRIVAIGNLLGFYLPQFFPQKPGPLDQLPRTLKPLADLRDNFTLYSGLDHDHKGGHFAVHSFLTGVLTQDAKGRADGNISVDQFAAESVGSETRFPSLTIGSESGIHGGCQMAWTRSGTRVPPIPGPRELFRKLFINDSIDDLEKARDQFHLHDSILDAVNHDATKLKSKLDPADQKKLEEYFTSVREVEQRLKLSEHWADVPKPKPPIPEPKNTNMVQDLPLLYDLIALALQTDSTRIATLELGGDFESRYFDIKKGYHALSHHGKQKESIDHLLVLEEYQMQQFARFLRKLKSIPEGGGTLLDNTLIIFGSGMSNANAHTNRNLPIIIAGGGFDHGTYKAISRTPTKRTPLCNLYLTLLQEFGLKNQTYFGTSTGTFI